MEMYDEVKVVRSYRKVNICADALAKASADIGEDLVLKEDISCFIRHLVSSEVMRTLVPRLVLLQFFFMLNLSPLYYQQQQKIALLKLL